MSTSLWYDDPVQLDQRIQNLHDLGTVCAARRENYRKCKNEFVFFGRIYSGGVRSNMIHLLNKVLPDTVVIPKVMFWDAFQTLLAQHGIGLDACWNRKEELTNYRYEIPPSHVLCSICGQGWTLDNCMDAHVLQDFADLPLDEHVGKTLGHVQDILLRHRSEAVYLLGWSAGNKTHVHHPSDNFVPCGQPNHHTLEEHEKEEECWEDVDLSYVVQEGAPGASNLKMCAADINRPRGNNAPPLDFCGGMTTSSSAPTATKKKAGQTCVHGGDCESGMCLGIVPGQYYVCSCKKPTMRWQNCEQ